MRFHKKIEFGRVFVYLACLLSSLFLSQIGDHKEPFSLALLYGMGAAGLSPILSALLYLLPALIPFEPIPFLLYAAQATLMSVGFYLQKRFGKNEFLKTGILPLVALSLSLGLFFAFAPFEGYTLPLESIKIDAIVQKVVIAAVIFLLAAVFAVSMKALLYKLL